MERMKPSVLVDKARPGRRIEFLDLSKVERKLGQRIRHVYHNTIQPGAVAGDHWHKRHAVAVEMHKGRLDIVLQSVRTGKRWRGTVREGDPLLLIPGYEYHAARNPGPGVAKATMYATTPPRNDADSYEYEPSVRLFPKQKFSVAAPHHGRSKR